MFWFSLVGGEGTLRFLLIGASVKDVITQEIQNEIKFIISILLYVIGFLFLAFDLIRLMGSIWISYVKLTPTFHSRFKNRVFTLNKSDHKGFPRMNCHSPRISKIN